MVHSQISKEYLMKYVLCFVILAAAFCSVMIDTKGNAASSIGFQFPTGAPKTGSGVWLHFGQSRPASKAYGHLGTDFKGLKGTKVYAAADGKVTQVTDGGQTWRGIIIVEHDTRSWGWDKNVYSMYAHVVPKPGLKATDIVVRGQEIGTIALKPTTSDIEHLHFEIRSGASAWWNKGPAYCGWTFSASTIDGATFGYSGIVWHNPYALITNNLFR